MKSIPLRKIHGITLFFALFSMVLLLSFCDTAGPAYDPVEITGQVVDADSDEPVVNAIVRIVQPRPEKSTVTDENGRFFFEINVDSTMDIRLVITKEGYLPSNLETIAIPERNIAFPVTKLRLDRDDDEDPIIPPDQIGGPFSIVLESVSSETISVKGTGDAEQAQFVFAVADSAGIPVRDAEVSFRLGSAPGGDEVVYPETATTDVSGRVGTVLTSGTASGTVQVIASIERDGFTVESRPVRITIQSGLPSDEHFTLLDPNPRIISVFEASQIAVMLGDRHGNPVSAGTSIYFTTTGGVISGSAQTDDNGQASVELRYGNPIPENGRAVVTAQTTDENNQTITRQTEVLFSTGDIMVDVNPASARLSELSGKTFNYTVTDNRGNPLPSGTTISVNTEGMDAQLSGDVNVTLEDHSQAGPGVTQFSFRVTEATRQQGLGNAELYFEIVVTGPSGAQSVKIPINYRPGGPASISLLSVSAETIAVKGTGDAEQAEFVFQVTDSSGAPVHQAQVDFRLGSSPGGGESVYPQTATTDVNGQVKTTLTSGTVSGTVQVIASIERETFTVESRPVRITIQSGLPNNDHFTLRKPDPESISENNPTSEISVMLGDRHGNPVSAGTSVYFTTTGGVIDASAQTDDNGEASVELRYGNPIPENGRAIVTARTTDENNQTITREVEVLFSSADILVSATPASARLSELSGKTFNYTVTDGRGNPLPAGSTVSVNAVGMDAQLSGDVDVTIGSASQPGPKVTEFAFTVQDAQRQQGQGNQDVYFEIIVNAPAGEMSLSIPISYRPGGPASISLLSASAETIAVKGTGDAEQAEFVFQVTDSSGAPVHQAQVDFRLGSSPGGGESVYPQTATTDVNGQVKTTLTSGTVSGTVQVIASIERETFTVESRPVRITIQSGLPSNDHFTLKKPEPVNIPVNGTSQISVLLGDRHGNPVAAGTSVYFTTTGGVIDASAQTGSNGQVSVQLQHGQPIPGNGRVTVTAQTTNENNQTITREAEVLFASHDIVVEADPSSVRLADLSGMQFSYTVTDSRGNPLPQGTNISVNTDGINAQLTGDVSVTLGDHLETGPGITDFTFRILSAEREDNFSNSDLSLKIEVSGPDIEKTKTIPVEYRPGGPASIVLQSISDETISVKETGAVEQAEFVFVVADSSGAPVHDAEVEFSLGSSPGGGEFVYPLTARSDNSGTVRTTLTSGTISGAVQVIATIYRDGFEVKSRPVRVAIQSGLPSDNHFTFYRPNPRNIALNGTSSISVMLGDRYGNPVSAGTRVYFTTNYGVIGASSVTNEDGVAGVTLRPGAPLPPDGFVTVTAQTVNENNQHIQRQSTVIFNAAPILIEVNPTTFDIDHLSDQTFNYTVTDANGNPLPGGSTITVTVEGQDIEVIGDVSITLGDHFFGGPGVTEFSFNVAGVNEEEHENKRPVFIRIQATSPTDSRTVQIAGVKAKEVID